MRKIIYTLFLFASFVASGIGIGKQDAQANTLALGNEPVKKCYGLRRLAGLL